MSCLTLIRNGRFRKEPPGVLRTCSADRGSVCSDFYDAEYNEDGTLKSFTPNNEYAPAVVKKRSLWM